MAMEQLQGVNEPLLKPKDKKHHKKTIEKEDGQTQPSPQNQDQNSQPTADNKKKSPSSDEAGSTQNHNQENENSTNATQSSMHASMAAAINQLSALEKADGHAEKLFYLLFGLPAEVDSTPRNFGIGTALGTIQKVYLPTLFPQTQQAALPANICCGPSSATIISEFFGSGTSLTIGADTYTFTFEYSCSTNSSQMVFTDTVGGSTTTLNIPIQSAGCFMPNCSDPITKVAVNPSAPGTGISIFVGTDLAEDAHGNFYNLVQLISGDYVYQPDCSGGGGGGLSAPIVLNLNHQEITLTSAENSGVLLNLNGTSIKTGWIGADDGFLTYGYSGQGPIQNEHFILTQNVPEAKTDLQALIILADQQDDILNANNPIWSKLGVWQDSNQNALMDSGEYHTLTQLDITSISLTATGSAQNVNGNIINGFLTFTYADGTIGQAADVSLRYEDVIQPIDNSIPSSTQGTSTDVSTFGSVAFIPVISELSLALNEAFA